MSKPKVFIVDDDPTFVKMLEHQLELADFTPFETYISGEECLKNMHHRPTLVLLDFSLGGLNGLDVLTKIKKEFPKTAVVMLTAVEDVEVEQRCLEAGASNYIRKDPDGLERLNNEVLPKYKRGGLFSFFN
jgi:CheY-like chemotaxis protein